MFDLNATEQGPHQKNPTTELVDPKYQGLKEQI